MIAQYVLFGPRVPAIVDFMANYDYLKSVNDLIRSGLITSLFFLCVKTINPTYDYNQIQVSAGKKKNNLEVSTL